MMVLVMVMVMCMMMMMMMMMKFADDDIGGAAATAAADVATVMAIVILKKDARPGGTFFSCFLGDGAIPACLGYFSICNNIFAEAMNNNLKTHSWFAYIKTLHPCVAPAVIFCIGEQTQDTV